MAETHAAVELADALADEWPDTPLGWLSYSDRYQLVEDIVNVLVTNKHVRSHVLALASQSDAERNGACMSPSDGSGS